MYYLFEESNRLDNPIECFNFDCARELFPIKPHWHYFTEIIYMVSGCAEIHTDGNVFFLNEGDMALFHPKAVHSIYSADGRPPFYRVLKFDINRLSLTPDYAPKLRSIFRSAEKKGMNIFFSSEKAEKMCADGITQTCVTEMNEQRYGFDLEIKAELYRLLIGIVRAWTESGFTVDSETYAEDSRYDIFSITEYIDANMAAGITVADIAERCGMSYSYFAKRFPAVYGKTCKEYIETMRVFKVEEYLSFTDFDLTYISQETGFSDCSHMIKSFRRINGITPKQFRLRHKKNNR